MKRLHFPADRAFAAVGAGLGAAGVLAAVGLVMPAASDYLWRASSSGGPAISTVSSPLVRVRALSHDGRPARLMLIAGDVAVCMPVSGRA
jgi:hypothetical protein